MEALRFRKKLSKQKMSYKKIISILIFFLVFPSLSFSQSGGFNIYIESWERISFRNPLIEEQNHAKMHSKKNAALIIKNNANLLEGTTEVMLGKNIHVNEDGIEAEINEIQEWLVSLGIKSIIFRLATSGIDPPVVKEFRDGQIISPDH